MKNEKIFNGFIKQEFASEVMDLIPNGAHINLNSIHDTMHLSLVVEFENEEDARTFKKEVIPYKANF